ncbi:antibiotic biosynthesis monooxygenase [Ornithinibacillus gellani]|nr:antibiotic biosynthesis monooxygenase [Ornithinibacillus gellani]
MNKFGLYNKFTTIEGKRDDLVEILLEASKSMEEVNECELYVISLDADNPDSIYVHEVWRDAQAHQASLSMEASQTLIQKAKPIIVGLEKMNASLPIGGKGISSISEN